MHVLHVFQDMKGNHFEIMYHLKHLVCTAVHTDLIHPSTQDQQQDTQAHGKKTLPSQLPHMIRRARQQIPTLCLPKGLGPECQPLDKSEKKTLALKLMGCLRARKFTWKFPRDTGVV